jgi:four helix bundle protein
MQSSVPDFIAWQRAMELATAVYSATVCFPKEEMFGLTNQLRRASVSIPSNMAEGQGRLTTGEFIQFMGIARGSALEVQTQLELAIRLGFGNREELEHTQGLAIEVLKIINAALVGLRTKQRMSNKKG